MKCFLCGLLCIAVRIVLWMSMCWNGYFWKFPEVYPINIDLVGDLDSTSYLVQSNVRNGQKAKGKRREQCGTQNNWLFTYLFIHFMVFISLYSHCTDFPSELLGNEKKGNREYSLIKMYKWMKLWTNEHLSISLMTGAILGTDIKAWPIWVRSEIEANAHR